MRREGCCRWIGAWPYAAAALLITSSIVCSSPAAARLSGPVPTGRGGSLRQNTRITSSAAVVEEPPCEYYLEEEEVVAGLEFCPHQLEPLRLLLLENKRRLLRLALDAVDDAGGESPLLLVNSLIQEAADLFFSGTRTFRGDVEGWIEREEDPKSHGGGFDENERFVDLVDTFYEETLRRSRPVVIYVTGRHACALWDELKPQEEVETESTAADEPVLSNIDLRKSAASAAADGKTPLAIMTLGWDDSGSPFVRSAFRECSTNILELPQVVQWFVSHHKGRSPSPKVEYVPVGFGGSDPRSGLQQSEIITPSGDKLARMDTCEADDGMEMLFQCNNDSPNTNRGPINEALQLGGRQADSDASNSSVVPHVIPDNHFPLEPAETVAASANGLFAVSPPGTSPDCFRHYEFLLAGNIVYVPDDPSLRIVLAGLPVIFVQGRENGWGKINCDNMAQHAQQVAHRLDQGLTPGGRPPFDYGKLMLPHWIRFVRDRVWQAAAEVRQASDEASLARYEPAQSEESRPYPDMVVGG